MKRTSMVSTGNTTGQTADRQSGRATRAVSTQVSYCYEIEVTAIPAWSRRKLPRDARFCSISEPAWLDETDGTDWCLVRIAASPDRLAHVRPVWLTHEEAHRLYRALDAVAMTPRSEMFALPVALLSAHLAETDRRPPVVSVEDLVQNQRSDLGKGVQGFSPAAAWGAPTFLSFPKRFLEKALGGELPTSVMQAMLDRPVAQADGGTEQAMLPLGEVWAVQSTGLRDDAGHVQVQATPIPERLEGRATGAIFTAWIDEHVLAAAPVYDHSLRDCDSLHRRAQVAAQVTAQGVSIPQPVPEPVREVAVPCLPCARVKDPIYLRPEDLEGINQDDPAQVLDRAISSLTEQEQVEPASRRRERLALARDWSEKVLSWYTGQPKKIRPRDLFLVRPMIVQDSEPIRTPSGKGRTRHDQPVLREVPRLFGYRLIVGVPLTLLPPCLTEVGDTLILPTEEAEKGQPVLRHVQADTRQTRRLATRHRTRPVATVTPSARRVIRRYRLLADGSRVEIARFPLLDPGKMSSKISTADVRATQVVA